MLGKNVVFTIIKVVNDTGEGGEGFDEVWVSFNQTRYLPGSVYKLKVYTFTRLLPHFNLFNGIWHKDDKAGDMVNDTNKEDSLFIFHKIPKEIQWFTLRDTSSSQGWTEVQRENIAPFRTNIEYCPSLNNATMKQLDKTGMANSFYHQDTYSCMYTPTNEKCYVKCSAAHPENLWEIDMNTTKIAAELTCSKTENTWKFSLDTVCRKDGPEINEQVPDVKTPTIDPEADDTPTVDPETVVTPNTTASTVSATKSDGLSWLAIIGIVVLVIIGVVVAGYVTHECFW
eukprot:489739_1